MGDIHVIIELINNTVSREHKIIIPNYYTIGDLKRTINRDRGLLIDYQILKHNNQTLTDDLKIKNIARGNSNLDIQMIYDYDSDDELIKINNTEDYMKVDIELSHDKQHAVSYSNNNNEVKCENPSNDTKFETKEKNKTSVNNTNINNNINYNRNNYNNYSRGRGRDLITPNPYKKNNYIYNKDRYKEPVYLKSNSGSRDNMEDVRIKHSHSMKTEFPTDRNLDIAKVSFNESKYHVTIGNFINSGNMDWKTKKYRQIYEEIFLMRPQTDEKKINAVIFEENINSNVKNDKLPEFLNVEEIVDNLCGLQIKIEQEPDLDINMIIPISDVEVKEKEIEKEFLIVNSMSNINSATTDKESMYIIEEVEENVTNEENFNMEIEENRSQNIEENLNFNTLIKKETQIRQLFSREEIQEKFSFILVKLSRKDISISDLKKELQIFNEMINSVKFDESFFIMNEKLNIVLDIDNTILFCSIFETNNDELERESDIISQITTENKTSNLYIKVRPGLDEFFKRTKSFSNYFINTHGFKSYGDKVAEHININYGIEIPSKNIVGRATIIQTKSLQQFSTSKSFLDRSIVIDDKPNVWMQDGSKDVVINSMSFIGFLKDRRININDTKFCREMNFPIHLNNHKNNNITRDIEIKRSHFFIDNFYAPFVMEYSHSKKFQFNFLVEVFEKIYKIMCVTNSSSKTVIDFFKSTIFFGTNFNLNYLFCKEEDAMRAIKLLINSLGGFVQKNNTATHFVVSKNLLPNLNQDKQTNWKIQHIINPKYIFDSFFFMTKMDEVDYKDLF